MKVYTGLFSIKAEKILNKISAYLLGSIWVGVDRSSYGECILICPMNIFNEYGQEKFFKEILRCMKIEDMTFDKDCEFVLDKLSNMRPNELVEKYGNEFINEFIGVPFDEFKAAQIDYLEAEAKKIFENADFYPLSEEYDKLKKKIKSLKSMTV